MNAVELIERKRDAGELDAAEIEWFVNAAASGSVPKYQVTSMLMAIYLNGLEPSELASWTAAMLGSGDVLDFSDIAGPKVDKHSTGGVGDKVSIPLAPLVATCGVIVPMMSGRGLGHTGGTLDKLESIPGFRTSLDPAEIRRVIQSHGMVLAGQTETLVPADRLFYALRDASGTVPSIPLISSSIMSKKLAEGLDALVLDVKVGDGAFMSEMDDARRLATTLVGLGRAHGVPVTALITSMDQPLGNEVGNASEIRESVEVLRGTGPADLTELVLRLGVEMLVAGRVTDSPDDARSSLEAAVASGAALAKLEDVVAAQSGDPSALTDWSRLPSAEHQATIRAQVAGTVTRCSARAIGVAAMRLGAGRQVAEDEVDPAVGISVVAKVGDEVSPGDPLAELNFNDEARHTDAMEVLESAWIVGGAEIESPPLILETVS